LRQQSPEFSDHMDVLYRGHILTKQLALAPVFRLLDAPLRRQLVQKMEMISLPAGALLFAEGDEGYDVYLVRSGAVALNLNMNGQERQFKTIRTGTVVGEISITTRCKRTASARAISDCRLLKLNGEEYRRLFEQHEALQHGLARRQVRQANEAREFIRQLNLVEGDDTCELLLKDIWRD